MNLLSKVVEKVSCPKKVMYSVVYKILRGGWQHRTTHNVVLWFINSHPKFYCDLLFYLAYGRNINWVNPVWLDDKINILKCTKYYENEKVVQCADKFRVREYVAEKGLAHILNEVYCDAENVDDLDIKNLPDRFVIKRNNDAGGVVVIDEKKDDSIINKELKELKETMSTTYGVFYAEYHYQRIKPHYYIEKYIETSNGGYPYDYKFFCLNGEPYAVLVCVGREDENTMKRFMVDMSFNLQDYMPGEIKVTQEEIMQYKPEIWDNMINVARRLSEDFDFVRVDLYDVDNCVVFGEMTFTPNGGRNTYFTEECQVNLGSRLFI